MHTYYNGMAVVSLDGVVYADEVSDIALLSLNENTAENQFHVSPYRWTFIYIHVHGKPSQNGMDLFYHRWLNAGTALNQVK